MANLLDNAANYGGGATVISVSTLDRSGSRESAGSPDNGNGTGRGERGGRIGRVAAGQDGVPTMIEIAVEDAGPGISDVERTKVFDRFYRGSASGRRGTGTGTGLGLALVAEHVRLMHGETWVESAPSGGARFVVTLPVLTDDEGPGW
jgi:signal transduction histidine kinase